MIHLEPPKRHHKVWGITHYLEDRSFVMVLYTPNPVEPPSEGVHGSGFSWHRYILSQSCLQEALLYSQSALL